MVYIGLKNTERDIMIKIMIIDDDEMSLVSLKTFLKVEGFEVEAFSNPLEALAALRNLEFDLIASDYRLPYMNGISLITKVRELNPEIKSILFTGYYTESTVKAAREAKINKFLAKPIRIKELINSIYNLVNLPRAEKHLKNEYVQ